MIAKFILAYRKWREQISLNCFTTLSLVATTRNKYFGSFPLGSSGLFPLVNLSRYLTDDARIVLPVHDSALIQCPRDEADAVAECTRGTMAEAFYEILGKQFPVSVETKISPHW